MVFDFVLSMFVYFSFTSLCGQICSFLLVESTATCNLALQWLESQGNTSGLANNTRDNARDVCIHRYLVSKNSGEVSTCVYVAFHSILWVYASSTHSGASSLSPGSTLDCRWIFAPILMLLHTSHEYSWLKYSLNWRASMSILDAHPSLLFCDLSHEHSL
jgi:hypothetical protein